MRSCIRKLCVYATLALVLSACGGGGGGDTLDVFSGGDEILSNTSNSTIPASLGTATLNWQAPLYRADGNPLPPGQIRGYRLYYGTSSGNYVYTVDIQDGSATTYSVSDLPLGTYYFVLTTLDVNGRESGFSAEAVKPVTSS